MNTFMPPPPPPWEGLHPLVVHFPIALLLVAPLFAVLALLPKVGRGFALATVVLLVLGTVTAYVSVESGEAAGGLVVRTPEINAVLAEHASLAGVVRVLYTIVTLAYAAIVIGLPLLPRKIPAAIPLATQSACVLAMLAGAMVLANTGHLGGRLVHELGVQAWFGGSG